MYNDEDLAAAVRDGVLSQEAVDAFQAYMVQGRPLPVVDEEHFRLVSGFNDIFVVIACLLLLAALFDSAVAGWAGVVGADMANEDNSRANRAKPRRSEGMNMGNSLGVFRVMAAPQSGSRPSACRQLEMPWARVRRARIRARSASKAKATLTSQPA